jgi:hypothetical protein
MPARARDTPRCFALDLLLVAISEPATADSSSGTLARVDELRRALPDATTAAAAAATTAGAAVVVVVVAAAADAGAAALALAEAAAALPVTYGVAAVAAAVAVFVACVDEPDGDDDQTANDVAAAVATPVSGVGDTYVASSTGDTASDGDNGVALTPSATTGSADAGPAPDLRGVRCFRVDIWLTHSHSPMGQLLLLNLFSHISSSNSRRVRLNFCAKVGDA